MRKPTANDHTAPKSPRQSATVPPDSLKSVRGGKVMHGNPKISSA